MKAVDYSKGKIDVPALMEPLELSELPASSLPKVEAADTVVELTIV